MRFFPIDRSERQTVHDWCKNEQRVSVQCPECRVLRRHLQVNEGHIMPPWGDTGTQFSVQSGCSRWHAFCFVGTELNKRTG
jgi:hypothetical protein